MEKGVRLGSGFVDILVAATSYTAWTLSTGKSAVIKKVHWFNNTGAGGFLQIGFTTLGAAWTPLMEILMVNGVDGELREDDLPIFGNSPQGFVSDTTLVTGTLGNIIVRGTVGGVTPTCRIFLEVEEV